MKMYCFIALNPMALIKFVALIDQFSRKTNNCIALTDKFGMIAAHYWLGGRTEGILSCGGGEGYWL
jgi:hypothetical protein